MSNLAPLTPLVLTTEEVAALLQCKATTVRKYVKLGKLKASRIGRDMRFRRADVEAYLDAQVSPEWIAAQRTAQQLDVPRRPGRQVRRDWSALRQSYLH